MRYPNLFLAGSFLLITSFVIQENSLSRVGSNVAEMKEGALFYLSRNEFALYGATDEVKKASKLIPVAERAAVVTAVGQLVKNYMMSSAIDTDYRKRIKDEYAGYEKPDYNNPSWKEKLSQANESNINLYGMMDANQLSEILEGLVSTHKMILDFYDQKNQEAIQAMENVGNSKAKSEAALEELIAIAPLPQKNLPEFKKRFAAFNAKKQIENDFLTESESYTNAMGEMNAKLAVDKHARIKLVLQNFLDTSANVDFTAKVYTDNTGKRKFVNPEYEQKPSDWKFYYRVGKEPVLAARSFAQQWLSELK